LSDPNPSAQRQAGRYDLEGVWGNILSSTVRIRNVSLGGVGVETQDALSVGRTYVLRVGDADGGQVLHIDVAWCRFMGTAIGEQGDVMPVYQAGARAQTQAVEDPEESDETPE